MSQIFNTDYQPGDLFQIIEKYANNFPELKDKEINLKLLLKIDKFQNFMFIST